MVDLNELLRVAGAIILVDMPDLEFIWVNNLPERWSQSTETTLPDGVTSLARVSWRGQ
jgi:hypothetical protein